MEVIEQPDRVESELVGALSDLDRSLPGTSLVPARVLAGPTLWNDDTKLQVGPFR